MTLALDLGMTLAQLEDSMSGSELTLWKAYYLKKRDDAKKQTRS